ncbi:DNA binding domain-containing protein, excisionase family [Lachnospiraceae bacterium XBD2001]|nr:DNA binding domain-containing protein, excisionase family [Lachnospiraceae bacterium XBD2001]
MRRIQLEGRQIGWLQVLGRAAVEGNSHRAMFRCKCQCGKECSYERGKLLKGEYPACPDCMRNPENKDVLDELAIQIAEGFAEEVRIEKEKNRESANNQPIELNLSDEQNQFIELAVQGNNILVDACIGSGKTTAIQALCNALPTSKRVLYLTYNRLLKVDAKRRIRNKNVLVTNYHGYASRVLREQGISAGVSDLIQKYLELKPELESYDVLIIDEYQDIEQEFADMLEHLKFMNPAMQIVVVGDMEQKIYDKTSLDVQDFICHFLGNYIQLQFTKCFRLSSDHAAMLGRIWGKTIEGVNEDCIVEEMGSSQIVEYLASLDTKDILCLGMRTGLMSRVLNTLELQYPEKFNKRTVYASIRDQDANSVDPKKNAAIFTTYDSSKGMERPICVVFDFTEIYWNFRSENAFSNYQILRNIFCVAASRGKQHIIFVKDNESMLSEETLSTAIWHEDRTLHLSVTDLYEFKYKEDVEDCYKLLDIRKIEVDDVSPIQIKGKDEMIDLTPCIGIFQEASYFNNYDIDTEIEARLIHAPSMRHLYNSNIRESVEKQILFLTAIETHLLRYMTQVSIPFVSDNQVKQIHRRLAERLNKDEDVQVPCELSFYDNEGRMIFDASGFADVVKDDVVYELKFVSELQHEHFLQCATYMLGLNKPEGILWNTKSNELFSIHIPDRDKLMKQIAKTVTKRCLNRVRPQSEGKNRISISSDKPEKFAVIDTETNWEDQVMSIGIVTAEDKSFKVIGGMYYVITPEVNVGGMYESVLYPKDLDTVVQCSRNEAIAQISIMLAQEGINKIFAYNASFDFNHLTALRGFQWYDIMRLAAYKQYNPKIDGRVECYKNGRMKKGYGVEPILQMLLDNRRYRETHNAFYDAVDELKIMQLLGHPLYKYDIAQLKDTGIGQQEFIAKKQSLSEMSERHASVNDNRENYSVETDVPVSYNSMNQSHMKESRTPFPAQIYTSQQAADALDVSTSTVYNLIKRGEISAVKRGNRYEIDVNSVDQYIEREERRRQLSVVTGLAFAGGMIILLLVFLASL